MVQKIRYQFKRNNRPGEYMGFEVSVCCTKYDGIGNPHIEPYADAKEFEEDQREEWNTPILWRVCGVTEEGVCEHLMDCGIEADALSVVAKLGGELVISW